MILLLYFNLEPYLFKSKIKPVVNYNSGVKVCDDPGSRNMMDTSGLRAIRINETIAKLEGKFEVKQTMQDWKVLLEIYFL